MILTPDIWRSGMAGVDIRHKLDDKNSQFAMHLHNCYELYFCRCDGNKFFVGNNIYEANRNDLFLFDPTDLHKISVAPQNEVYDRYVTLFSREALFAVCGEDCDTLLSCFDRREDLHSHKVSLSEDKAAAFIQLLDNATNDTTTWFKDLKMQLGLGQILLFVYEEVMLQRSAVHASVIIAAPKKQGITARAMYYVANHFTEDVTLDALAKQLFIDKHHLCRRFKAESGFGLHDFVNSCRLSHAIRLLQQGETVTEAAMQSGFGSYTYFITTFSKAIGVTPKQYAKSFTAES
jgi:AraC-like DNA-binding protein